MTFSSILQVIFISSLCAVRTFGSTPPREIILKRFFIRVNPFNPCLSVFHGIHG